MLDVQAVPNTGSSSCASPQKGRRTSRLLDSWSLSTYADVNEELNNEGENIRSLNGTLYHCSIEYCGTNVHTKSVEERSAMIERDYKSALRRVQVIVEEAKAARLETSARKK